MRFWVPVSIILLWAAMAVFGHWLNLAPDQVQLERILWPPSAAGWLGFDHLGRPLLDRVISGALTSFWVAAGVVSISSVLGSLIGGFSAYLGGWWDRVLVRIMDVFLAFPGMLLAIALAGVLGPGLNNVVLALVIVGWVGYARLARAQVLSLKHREHILAAQTLGASKWRIITLHLLPLMLAPLLVEVTFGIAGVVIAEAGLSFLGLGVQPPAASWGSMVKDGARYMLVAPHMVIVPGMAVMLVVLAANLLGDWLRDRLDVRSRLLE